MKKLLATALGLLALALGLGWSGCASAAGSSARVTGPRTYAIVVADAQGLLAPAELQRVEIGVVQFLLDEGYVRHDMSYIRDVVHADVVFRVQIAWQNAAAGSFTVADVQPSYGGTPVAAYAADVGPPYPYPYEMGYYEPWLYGDYFGGYEYGPWSPFLGVAPFLPIYGGGHAHRPFPPVARHDPDEKKGNHRNHPPGGYVHQEPRWGNHPPYRVDPNSGSRPPFWTQDNGSHRRDRDHDARGTATSPTWTNQRPPSGVASRSPAPGNSTPWARSSDSGNRSYPNRDRGFGSGYRSAPRTEASSNRGYSSAPQRNYSSPAPSRGYSAPAPSYSPPSRSSSSYSAPAASSAPASSSSAAPAHNVNSNNDSRNAER